MNPKQTERFISAIEKIAEAFYMIVHHVYVAEPEIPLSPVDKKICTCTLDGGKKGCPRHDPEEILKSVKKPNGE